MGCHALWTWLNKEEHDESFPRSYDPRPYIPQRLKEYDEAKSMNTATMGRGKTISMVKWKPPSRNMVKLNANGVCKEKNVAGCDPR